MPADILGTSCDQCRSMVQYRFTSTEPRRLVRTDSPGRQPRLSHSSWTMWLLLFVLFCFYICSFLFFCYAQRTKGDNSFWLTSHLNEGRRQQCYVWMWFRDIGPSHRACLCESGFRALLIQIWYKHSCVGSWSFQQWKGAKSEIHNLLNAYWSEECKRIRLVVFTKTKMVSSVLNRY